MPIICLVSQPYSQTWALFLRPHPPSHTLLGRFARMLKCTCTTVLKPWSLPQESGKGASAQSHRPHGAKAFISSRTFRAVRDKSAPAHTAHGQHHRHVRTICCLRWHIVGHYMLSLEHIVRLGGLKRCRGKPLYAPGAYSQSVASGVAKLRARRRPVQPAAPERN